MNKDKWEGRVCHFWHSDLHWLPYVFRTISRLLTVATQLCVVLRALPLSPASSFSRGSLCPGHIQLFSVPKHPTPFLSQILLPASPFVPKSSLLWPFLLLQVLARDISPSSPANHLDFPSPVILCLITQVLLLPHQAPL